VRNSDHSKPSSPSQLSAEEMKDDDVVALLQKRPKEVPQLRSRDSYRNFFRGVPKDRMHRLLCAAASAQGGDEEAREARVERRMALLSDVLAD